MWPEVERVLKPGGTAAFWVSLEMLIETTHFLIFFDCACHTYLVLYDICIMHHGNYQVYSEFRLPQYPSVTPLITKYAQGTDLYTSLGPHWERPGRTVLERHLLDVPSPEKVLGKEGKLAHEERCYFAGKLYHPSHMNT